MTERDVKQWLNRAHNIDKVENGTYRLLLTLRYIRFMTWEQVAEEMNYSYVHVVYNLHSAALRQVKELIEFNINL